MKQRNRGSKKPHSIDPDFIDALDENDFSKRSSSRQIERKTQQFCRQVQRALNFAMGERGIGEGVDGLFAQDVTPAPDCGCLLVHIVMPLGLSVTEVMSALRREVPRLRSEVALAISRKRAPELCFVPAHSEGGYHE